MNPASILAGLLIMAFAALGSAKLAAVPAMRAKAQHVGLSVSAYRRIGFAEVLAVLGGAIVAHLRNGDGLREIAPAVVLGLVALSFLLLVVGDLR